MKRRGLTAFFCSRKSPTHHWSCFHFLCGGKTSHLTRGKKKKRGMSIIVHFSSCWKREFRLLFQKRALGSCGETLDDFESYHITIRNSEEEIAQTVRGLARCQDCGAFESRLIFVPFRCQPSSHLVKTKDFLYY